jgi:hypothetical protein
MRRRWVVLESLRGESFIVIGDLVLIAKQLTDGADARLAMAARRCARHVLSSEPPNPIAGPRR